MTRALPVDAASRLRPWLRALGKMSEVAEWTPQSRLSKDRSLWVRMATVPSTHVDPRGFEALELLALVGEMDFGAWCACIDVAWGDSATPWARAANGSALRLGLELTFPAYRALGGTSVIDAWCERVVVGGIEHAASPGYVEMRRTLETEYTARDRTGGRWPQPTRRSALVVPVHLSLEQGDYEKRLWQILQLASVQHTRDGLTSTMQVFGGQEWAPLYRLSEVSAGVDNSCTPKALLLLAQIAGSGVVVNHLSLVGAEWTGRNASLVVPALQMLLATKTNQPESVKLGFVKNLEIPARLNRQTVAAIYSALSVSQSVRSVRINSTRRVRLNEQVQESPVEDTDRDYLWQWIAFSVFSRHARNAVEDVRLHVGDLRDETIPAIRSALDHPNPARFLLDQSEFPNDSSLTMVPYATASKFRLAPPEPAEEARHIGGSNLRRKM